MYNNGEDSSAENSHSKSIGGAQMTIWTMNLFLSESSVLDIVSDDPHVFATAFASCAINFEPPAEIIDNLPGYSPQESQNRMMSIYKDLSRQFGDSISGRFALYYDKGYSFYFEEKTKRNNLLKSWQDDARDHANNYKTSIERNIVYLSQILSLEKVDSDILYFQCLRTLPGFKELYTSLLTPEISNFFLSTCLDHSITEIREARDKNNVLMKSGLLTGGDGEGLVPMSRDLLQIIIKDKKTKKDFEESFVNKLKKTTTSSSIARLQEQDEKTFRILLDMSLKDGFNILFYSKDELDKLELLRSIIKQEKLEPYLANTKDISSIDVPAVIFIAQKILKNRQKAVLVVDKAEYAFTRRSYKNDFLFGLLGETVEALKEDTENSSDDVLLSSGINTVWMSSSPGTLTEENLSKFLYHCEVLPGSRSARRDQTERAIKGLKVSPEIKQELAKYNLLGERSVEQAVAVAKQIQEHCEENKVEIDYSSEDIIKRAIQQSQKILGRESQEELRTSVTKYSLKNLNLSSTFKPEQIIKALKKRPHGTICLYGIPGAGKTQLAEHIAVELDKPILMKRASDLLSKWLGESEQNIAGMFAEAEREDAILFLDEADSFLRDRTLARAEWSVTQVNELLQRMERFPGIFIAATNLFEDIDAAALRRFSWKLEFLPLTHKQAWGMFTVEAGLNKKEALVANNPLYEKLIEIENLTPGDFATVKRQELLLDEKFSQEEWLEQLGSEAKAKMAGLKRNKIGI